MVSADSGDPSNAWPGRPILPNGAYSHLIHRTLRTEMEFFAERLVSSSVPRQESSGHPPNSAKVLARARLSYARVSGGVKHCAAADSNW